MSRKLLLPRGVLMMMRQQLGSTEADKFICSLALGYQRRELCGSWKMNISMALLRNPLQGMRYADTKGL